MRSTATRERNYAEHSHSKSPESDTTTVPVCLRASREVVMSIELVVVCSQRCGLPGFVRSAVYKAGHGSIAGLRSSACDGPRYLFTQWPFFRTTPPHRTAPARMLALTTRGFCTHTVTIYRRFPALSQRRPTQSAEEQTRCLLGTMLVLPFDRCTKLSTTYD